jgi:hypothetical protein
LLAFGDERLYRAPRHERTAFGFPQRPAQVVYANLREALRDLRRRQSLVRDAEIAQRPLRVGDVAVLSARHPQHARAMENRLPAARVEFFPHAKRAHRPTRIQRIRTVTHADHARFAARTRTTVRGAERIEQDHGMARVEQ